MSLIFVCVVCKKTESFLPFALLEIFSWGSLKLFRSELHISIPSTFLASLLSVDFGRIRRLIPLATLSFLCDVLLPSVAAKRPGPIGRLLSIYWRVLNIIKRGSNWTQFSFSEGISNPFHWKKKYECNIIFRIIAKSSPQLILALLFKTNSNQRKIYTQKKQFL